MDRGGTITWHIDADDRDFDSTMRRVQAQSRVTGDAVDKNITKGTKRANDSLTTFRVELAKTASVFRNFQIATRGFTMTAVILGVVGVTGAIIELAGAIAALGPLVFTLPAFLGALGGAFATVKTATYSMGDAFEAVANEDAKDLAEAMEKLSPNAQKVVKAFQGVYNSFKPIRSAIQEKFFEGLDETLTKTAKVTLPTLEKGMSLVAIQMNYMAKRAGVVAQSPIFQSALTTIFETTANAVEILIEGLDSLVGIFSGLVEVTSPYVELLAEWLVIQLNLASVFLQSAEGQSRLTGSIDLGIVALKSLMGLLGAVGGLLQEVFRQSNESGVSFILTLTNAFNAMTAFLQSAEGGAEFQAFLRVTNVILEQLLVILGQAAQVIFSVTAAFDALPKPVQEAIATFLGIVAIISVILPYLTAVASSIELIKDAALVFIGPLGLLIVLLGGLAFALGSTAPAAQAFQQFFAGIPAMINNFVAGLPALVSQISGVLTNIVDTMIAGLPMLIRVGSEILLALINGILVALPLIIGAVIDIGIKLLEGIVKILPQLLEAGVKIILAIVDGLLKAIPKLIKMIPALIMAIISAIVTALPLLLDAGIKIVKGIIEGIVSNLPAIITAIVEMITTLVNYLAQNAGMIIEAGLKLVNALLDGIISSIDLIINAAITIVIALATALIQSIPILIPAIIKLVLAIAWALISNAPLIIEALAKIIFLMVGGIISRIPLVVGAIGKLILGLLGKFGSHADDFLIAAFNLIIRFANGINNAAGTVINAISRLIGSLLAPLRGGYQSFVNAGGDLIRGLVNGIASAQGAVINKVKEIASGSLDAIKKFFGIKSPSRVMAKIGDYMMEGLEKGIIRTGEAVVSTTQGIANNIASTFGVLDGQSVTQNVNQTMSDVTGAGGASSAVSAPGNSSTVATGQGVTVHQTNNVYTELDMNQVNRNLTWELNKL